MVESRLSDEVRALVQNHLASMTHLDALLLLAGAPETALPAETVAERIGADRDAAARALRDLVASALVAEEETAGVTGYRFAPGDEALRKTAETLSEMYRRFPVQVIRAVYERPPSAVQQLADAFKLRK